MAVSTMVISLIWHVFVVHLCGCSHKLPYILNFLLVAFVDFVEEKKTAYEKREKKIEEKKITKKKNQRIEPNKFAFQFSCFPFAHVKNQIERKPFVVCECQKRPRTIQL